MKKLLFTLAALLIAGNAMADRVVTFSYADDDMEQGSAVYDELGLKIGDYWTMSKDGVTISIFSGNNSNPCTEDNYFVGYYSIPEEEANLRVYSELYSVDDDAPMYERYYGGISKIELNCSESPYYGPRNLEVLRPHSYGGYFYEDNMGYYICDSEFGHCPQFVDFGTDESTKIYTITVTLYGVDDDTPVIPDIPTERNLTVCDGGATNSYVPIYGLYVDTYGTMGQMIYPADMLTDMVGKEITELKFYSPSINFYNATLQVGLAKAEKDDFEDYTAIDGATILGTAVPNEGDAEMTFVFDEPYLYEGGNLMIQVVVTEIGEWNGTSFYGQNTNNYSSYYQYQYSWSDTPSKFHTAFLPKATFTYKDGGDVPPVEPTEKTGAPVFNGYTTDGIHAYFVEILPTDEGSVIYYRVLYPGEEEYTEWAVYEEILSFEGDGKHRVEAYAVAPNKLPSEQIAYEFVVEPVPPTSISEMMNGKTVAGVRYFNMAGQEMTEANGMTIVVTTYTDGTTSAVKVVK